MDKGFIWHKVTEEEKEEIRKFSKNLLNRFSEKILKVKSSESHFERGEGARDEGEGWNTDPEFRDIMLLNAPFVEDDSIVAEKGRWKK